MRHLLLSVKGAPTEVDGELERQVLQQHLASARGTIREQQAAEVRQPAEAPTAEALMSRFVCSTDEGGLSGSGGPRERNSTGR